MTKAGVILMFTVLTVRAGLSQLDAISMIESGDNDAAIGTAGEVSRYQIRPQVWERFSQSREYDNPRVAGRVAQQHLDWLAKFFSERTGRTAEDFDLVLKSIRSGHIPTADLHTHRAPLQELPAALAQWLKPESMVIKAMVEC